MELVNALHLEKSLKKLTHHDTILASKILSYAERNCTYFYTGIGNVSEDMHHTTTAINHIHRSARGAQRNLWKVDGVTFICGMHYLSYAQQAMLNCFKTKLVH